ncbi:glycosyltransferase family 39 protein [Erythrobacter sp. SD-21]|uniref:ArnT family glycosyltransferase n=1 Tax=Erythrobacter sp. SD-21 TaxID=161528 RepID=UPI000153FBA4|nr:glycosyltransferase family 39 protein [Erythrobacter sp. SD-21]EDL47919.1 hypothetical protein ED21_25272 [Erythrobacter sp. SD-21]
MTARIPVDRLAAGGFLLLFAIAQLALAFRLNINWDEYYFLSHIYAFGEDRLTTAMQTFYVRPLAWLSGLPGSESDQVVYGRLFMLLCEAGSLFCLYRIARRFFGTGEALLAVAAWCAAGFALAHGASFRADPFAGVLMMVSLAVLVCGRMAWSRAVFAGLLAALSLMVTLKSAFFLPAFLGAFLLRMSEDETEGFIPVLRHFAKAGAVCIAALVALWLWHARGLPSAPMITAPGDKTTLASGSLDVLDKVVFSQALFPRWPYIALWISQSVLSLLLIVIGLWFAFKRIGEKDRRVFGIALLLFALPLVSLVFYRNAFSYFFPFILLPAALLAAAGASRIAKPLHRVALVAAMASLVAIRLASSWQMDQSAQRQIAEAVHEAFPEPVSYIDRNGIIPSFPKSGFFMSTWGTEQYLEGKHPPLAATIRRDQPPLLILNTPILEDAVFGTNKLGDFRLLDKDGAILRDDYVEHWGPVWVAGKTIASAADRFEIVLAGEYTLECEGRAAIDGKTLSCGSTVTLDQGIHDWSGPEAVLRWGDHLPRPAEAPPTTPIYYGF